MIDESGNARITDFGLTKIVRGSNSVPSTSRGQGQTLRWTAPELLESDDVVTKESDVHSFAMVVIEVGWLLIFGMSSVSLIGQGFYWGSSFQRIPGNGSRHAHHKWRTPRTAQSPQIYR